MPCWTIQTVKVQEKLVGLDASLLKKALIKLAFSVQILGGKLVFTNGGIRGQYDGNTFSTESAYGSLDINQVKQAYSVEVVESTAVDYGWILTKTAENEYELEKPY